MSFLCCKKVNILLIQFLLTCFFSFFCQCQENEKKQLPLNTSFQKKYNFSICSIFKDEAAWLQEWIEYHLLVGTDHFYLYNNMSTDSYMDVLEPYIKKNIVTIIDWPDRSGKEGWVCNTQSTALLDGCHRSASETTWLALIDIDEFLVPVTVTSMPSLLSQYAAYSGVLIYWHVFGTSNIKTLPPKTLLIEALHKTTPLSYPDHPKSIVKPEMVSGFSWPPHKCTYVNGQNPFNISKNIGRINHYINRTEDFLTEKIKKKNTWKAENSEKMGFPPF